MYWFHSFSSAKKSKKVLPTWPFKHWQAFRIRGKLKKANVSPTIVPEVEVELFLELLKVCGTFIVCGS